MSRKIDMSELAECTNCACFNLRKAARAVTQLYEEILRPTGLRATQFSLLVAASLFGPITVTRLAEMGVIDRTTLTRNFKPLVKRGYIEVVLGKDRRTRVVSLTGRGGKVLRKALPLWKKAQAHVVRKFGRERWNSLQSNLREVVSLANKS